MMWEQECMWQYTANKLAYSDSCRSNKLALKLIIHSCTPDLQAQICLKYSWTQFQLDDAITYCWILVHALFD